MFKGADTNLPTTLYSKTLVQMKKYCFILMEAGAMFSE